MTYYRLIRVLLDQFQMSHTIIETSDSLRLPRDYPIIWMSDDREGYRGQYPPLRRDTDVYVSQWKHIPYFIQIQMSPVTQSRQSLV